MNSNNLPIGWVWTRLGEIITFEYGKGLREDKRDQKGNVPVYGSNGIVGHHSVPLTEKPCLVVGRKGTAGYVHLSKVQCWPIDTTYFITPPDELDLFFLYYLLSTLNLNSLDRSTAIPGLNRNDAYALKIPLPPLPEQRRIVTKLEELFTKLDAGVSALKKTQAQLKRYRQSVLKAACEGKLVPTEAELARAEGREYEAADVLLARILKEGRGKSGKGAKYKEPAAPDTGGLPELPEGWGWASLEQLSWDSGYGTSEKCDYHFRGPPVLRIPNINEGKIVLDDLKFALESTNLNDSESLKYGDMLVIRTNGSKDLIGRAGVVTQDFSKPHFFASYLIRFRIVELGGLPIWLSSIWHTLRIRSWIERVAATSAGQYNISMSTLNKLPLELPPLAEQRRIVAEVERRLSVADEVARTVEQSLVQAQRLRQSILKKAFEGKLVAQAPEDEPASVLLEKIRLQKQLKSQKRKSNSSMRWGKPQTP